MPTHIVKMTDDQDVPWYFMWSTVIDAPTTCAMTLDELREFYREEHGRRGMEGLDRHLNRVEAKGISALHYDSPEDIETCNRAGKDETWLSLDQILALSIARRDDIDAEIEGVDQDMICSMCAKPIATEAERVWEGAGDDPAHASCVVDREHHAPRPG